MNFLAAIALIGILILIHEFGHFIVAKACGVHCEVFSIGFGRKIIGFRYGGTDYRIALLPFGGYVRMKGSDVFGDQPEDYTPEEDEDAFLNKPVWKRLLIVAAGPVFNLILPVVVFTMVFLGGEPQPEARIGTILPGSVAEEVGVEVGDRILGVYVEGALVETDTLVDVYDALEALPAGSDEIRMDFEGTAGKRALTLKVSNWNEDGVPRLDETGMLSTMASSEIGVDDPESPAGRAGLATGDVLTNVNGQDVKTWPDVQAAIAMSAGPHEIRYLREDVEQIATLERSKVTPNSAMEWSGEAGFDADEVAWGLAPASLFVAEVSEGSPAEAAGITPGDRLLAIDGQSLVSWAQVLRIVAGSADGRDAPRTLDVDLVRAGASVQLQITPDMIEETDAIGRPRIRPILGVARDGAVVDTDPIVKRYGAWNSFVRAVDRTVWLTGATAAQIGRIITGEVAPEKSLGGPVEIVRQAQKAAEEGIYRWASLMGMLSISLGLINLLPVPVLDGGQLLFYGIELVRGRPVSVRVREMAQQIGVLFLIALMLFVLVVDVNRWLGAL